MPIQVQELLRSVHSDEKARVQSVVLQYKDRVRDKIQDAASLTFNRTGQSNIKVTVQVEDGAAEEIETWQVRSGLGVLLAPYEASLTAGVEALELMQRLAFTMPPELSDDYGTVYDSDATASVTRSLKELLRQIEERDVLRLILGEVRDPLGRYEPRQKGGAIQLYWQMIALCASRLRVSTEALTLKVLAHEYAHALSHLGMDADGHSWDLESFGRADIRVHEGLANFWSWQVLQKDNGDWLMRQACEALEAIFPLQSLPYAEFDLWRKAAVRPEKVREAVRLAREQKVAEIEAFRYIIGVRAPGNESRRT